MAIVSPMKIPLLFPPRSRSPTGANEPTVCPVAVRRLRRPANDFPHGLGVRDVVLGLLPTPPVRLQTTTGIWVRSFPQSRPWRRQRGTEPREIVARRDAGGIIGKHGAKRRRRKRTAIASLRKPVREDSLELCGRSRGMLCRTGHRGNKRACCAPGNSKFGFGVIRLRPCTSRSSTR